VTGGAVLNGDLASSVTPIDRKCRSCVVDGARAPADQEAAAALAPDPLEELAEEVEDVEDVEELVDDAPSPEALVLDDDSFAPPLSLVPPVEPPLRLSVR
jgi:hypothetical protein